MAMMSQAAPPVLTVRYNGAERTFAAGHDVVVGRDLRADVRVGHPLISRAHLVLRFDQGRWVAIDNGSLNGLYVNNRRVPGVDIHDGQQVNIGNPDGPALTFEVGRHQGSVGRPPQTTSLRIVNPPSGSVPSQAPPQAGAHWPGQPPQPPPTSRLQPARRPPQTTSLRIVNPPSGSVPSQAPPQAGAHWPGQPPQPPPTSRLQPA
ncbi:FHA domain-containing protein, partial [Mycobacterium lacus]|uniref:FHA domain-containing protein n=1 Tax=Mycobacterium lacus TaxID=169765 RepID=UPI003555DC37